MAASRGLQLGDRLVDDLFGRRAAVALGRVPGVVALGLVGDGGDQLGGRAVVARAGQRLGRRRRLLEQGDRAVLGHGDHGHGHVERRLGEGGPLVVGEEGSVGHGSGSLGPSLGPAIPGSSLIWTDSRISATFARMPDEMRADLPDAAALLREHGLQVTAQRLAVLRAVAEHPAQHRRRDRHGRAPPSSARSRSQAVYDVLPRSPTRAWSGASSRPARRRATRPASATTTTTSSAARCGGIVDVDCAVGDAPCLTAADDAGFVIDEAEVIYWGRCPDCVAATRPHARHDQPSEPARASTTMTRPRQREREPGHPVARARRRDRPRTNQDWWPEPARPLGAAPALAAVEPAGRGLRLRRRSSRSSTSRR